MRKKQKNKDALDVAIASTTHELTQRYGEAGSQFLIGLRGVDQVTGKVLDRSLLQVSQGKLNPEYFEQNVKQQAGYSAEIASINKRNAQAIIDGEHTRFYRSEDIAKYGKNHNIVDIVELANGSELTSQMKFVSNTEGLLKKIAQGEGGGKTDLSRYMNVDKLEVPTEQVSSMKVFCRMKGQELKEQARRVTSEGKTELGNKLQKQAHNYEVLEEKISDSGLTTEEAIRWRRSPRTETAKAIAKTSHQAGIQGAKFGAALGGGISVVSNIVAVRSGDKAFTEALMDSAKDTLIGGAVGYGSAASGAMIKSYMQQSGSTVTRSLSKTALPSMIVATCVAMRASIVKYVNGQISAEELSKEMGLTASGMLSASAFTAMGQLAIPIPVLGGLIGGLIGYTLTNTFYQSFFDVLQEKKLSAERRQQIEMQCMAAKMIAQQYQLAIDDLFSRRLATLQEEGNAMFALLDNPEISADDFCLGMNRFAKVLGKELSINSVTELDRVMMSDEPFKI